MHNIRSEINYCQGNRSLVVSLTNLAIKVATGAAREAARAAGHAGATAHMADHELGAAAYAIRAVRAAAPPDKRDEVGRVECQWQREQLPDAIRALVLSDEDIRNRKFWSLFQ